MKVKLSAIFLCLILVLGWALFSSAEKPLIRPFDVKLNDLQDINIGTLSDEDIIAWDSTTEKWISAASPATESSDIDHDATANFVANEHLNHTSITLTAAGLISGGGTIAANRTFTLTEATIESAIDTLGAVDFTGAVDFVEDVSWTLADAADKITIDQGSESGTEDQALILITDAREGATVDEASEATLRIQSEGLGLVVIGKTYLEGDIEIVEDLTFSYSSAADKIEILQTDATGTDGQPLINIDDDRTGTNANTVGEATIVLNAAGTYALYVQTGQFYAAQAATFNSTVLFNQNVSLASYKAFAIGDANASLLRWHQNGSADEFFQWSISDFSASTKAIIIIGENVNPANMTDHNDYEAPTLVLLNTFGGDSNDYAGVVMGERAQVDITAAHYFDFYAMTGALDGSVDGTATELAAIFRIGASGSLTPVYATTPGDLFIEGAFEVNDKFLMDVTNHTILIGDNAGEDLSIGNGVNNIMIGDNAGNSITTGDRNIIIGYQAGDLMTVASDNILIGAETGTNLPATSNTGYNVFIGTRAGRDSVQYAEMNVFIGYQAGMLNQGGYDNVAIGMYAGDASISGYMNVYVGNDAGSAALGTGNTMVGGYAGTVATGGNLTLFGNSAGRNGTTFNGVTYLGRAAGFNDIDGGWNVAVGDSAGFTQTAAWYNVSVGYQAAFFNASGQNNTMIGYNAGYGVTGNSHDKNTFIGSEAGELIETGDNNVIIGFQAAEDISSGTGNVVIGYMAANAQLTTGSNQLWIANSSTATPLIYGDFGTADLKISGNLLVTEYNRSDFTLWIDCFDHGSTAAKYGQDWDIASLNTQGGGSNTIQTNPGNITMTSDSNGVGDNEGTRTDYQIVDRAALNRSEIGVTLGQTANTQFYFGWNDDTLNAMDAAADKYVIVFFDVSDNANWQIKVGDGSTEDVHTSSTAGATSFISHEIWVEADGTVHWLINGTEEIITGTVDNKMDAADHYLIVGQVQSVTGAAAIVADIGYVENEKHKDH